MKVLDAVLSNRLRFFHVKLNVLNMPFLRYTVMVLLALLGISFNTYLESRMNESRPTGALAVAPTTSASMNIVASIFLMDYWVGQVIAAPDMTPAAVVMTVQVLLF